MAGPWERYAPQDTTDTPKGPWEKYAAPTVTETPEQATDAMSVPDKFTRAGIKGLTTGASGLVNTLGKTIEGADPKKLAKLQQLIGAVEERMGVDASQYAPASGITGDSNRPLTERLANVPRSVVEMAGPAALGFAAGGLPGAIATTTATTAGPTIDRKREALGLRPDQELSTKAKYEVGTKLGLDAALLAAGGQITKGLMGPIEQTGVRGLTEAGKRAALATTVDAGFGMDAAAVDKGLIDKQVPTLSDLAVGAAQGALPGLAAHAPGLAGKVPGAVGEVGAAAGGAVREPFVNRAFKPLESLEPESRGRVADLIGEYGGGKNGMNAAENTLHENITAASKGLEDVTKEKINKIKNAVKEGAPVKPEWLDDVNQADPVAGRAVHDLVTFGAMRDLEQSALGNKVSSINPFENFKTRVSDYALAHLFSPKLAAIAAGLQTATALGAKGIDKLTGLDNPASVITDRYAGTASPTPTVAEARASVFAKDLADRQAKAEAAKSELSKAKAEKTSLDEAEANRKAAVKAAKEKARADAAAMKIARDSLNARRNSDAINERYNQEQIGNFQDKANDSLSLLDNLEREDARVAAEKQKTEDDAVGRQANLMRNSQAVEERRVAAEASAQAKLLRQQRSNLAIRERSDIPVSEALGRDLGDSQNVPLQELVSSSASPAIKTALGVKRIFDQAEKNYWAEQRNKLAIRNNSDIPASEYLGKDLGVDQNVPLPGMVSTSAALPLALARMKNPDAAKQLRNSFKSSEETGGLDVSNLGDANSTPITVRPAEVSAKMTMDKVSKKAKESAEKKTAREQQVKDDAAKAKAEKKVADATVNANEAAKDADENLHVFEHRGQKIRPPKGSVGNPSTYLRSFKEKTDRRMDVIDGAKALTKSKEVTKLLDTLAKDWTDTTNNPALAYDHLERIVNKPNMPKNVADYLLDKWNSIEGTWATARRDIENE